MTGRRGAPGRDAYRALEAARESFAASIGAANPSEVIFTGAGTEADNAAVLGIARAARGDSVTRAGSTNASASQKTCPA